MAAAVQHEDGREVIVMFWWGLAVGLFVGCFIGMTIMGLCHAAARGGEEPLIGMPEASNESGPQYVS